MTISSKARSILRRVPLSNQVRARYVQPVAEHGARLDHHDQALHDLTAAVQQLQADTPQHVLELQLRLDLIESHLPELLNTISSAHGTQRQLQRGFDAQQQVLKDHATSIVAQWERIEMIRRELMFELRYGATTTEPAAVEPKVLDPEKFEQARQDGLRLNLGCGHLAIDGYVNVDARDLPGVDVVAPVDNLPVGEGEAVELYSAHLVEHFPLEELERRVLPYWVSLLRPGGEFRAVVPDAGAMLTGHAEGSVSYGDLREVLYGGQEYEGDFHFNMYTTDSLGELLTAAGLVDVEVEAEGRRNGSCLEFQIVARRPAND